MRFRTTFKEALGKIKEERAHFEANPAQVTQEMYGKIRRDLSEEWAGVFHRGWIRRRRRRDWAIGSSIFGGTIRTGIRGWIIGPRSRAGHGSLTMWIR